MFFFLSSIDMPQTKTIFSYFFGEKKQKLFLLSVINNKLIHGTNFSKALAVNH